MEEGMRRCRIAKHSLLTRLHDSLRLGLGLLYLSTHYILTRPPAAFCCCSGRCCCCCLRGALH